VEAKTQAGPCCDPSLTTSPARPEFRRIAIHCGQVCAGAASMNRADVAYWHEAAANRTEQVSRGAQVRLAEGRCNQMTEKTPHIAAAARWIG